MPATSKRWTSLICSLRTHCVVIGSRNSPTNMWSSWPQELRTQRSVSSLSKCSTSITWKLRAVQQDPANQELLRLLNRERQAHEKQREAQDELRSDAKVVPEKGLNVDLKNIVDSKSKRLRKKPERFSDINWTNCGKRGATISTGGTWRA